MLCGIRAERVSATLQYVLRAAALSSEATVSCTPTRRVCMHGKGARTHTGDVDQLPANLSAHTRRPKTERHHITIARKPLPVSLHCSLELRPEP